MMGENSTRTPLKGIGHFIDHLVHENPNKKVNN